MIVPNECKKESGIKLIDQNISKLNSSEDMPSETPL